jgi:hypothetical protein
MERDLQKVPRPEASKQETLPTVQPNRVVVFGSRLSGAQELSEMFQKYLETHGIPNPNVHFIRSVENIESGFFDFSLPTNDAGWGPVYNTTSKSPTLPRGAILLPDMRWYDEWGHGMHVETYGSGIDTDVRKLCAKYGVPLAEIHETFTPQEIEETMTGLFLTEGQ